MSNFKVVFSILLMLVALCAPVHAGTIYVDAGAGGGDGTSWGNAYTDLQAAIDAAVSGDEVWVAAGTYYPSSQPTEIDTGNTRYNHFALKNGVAVYGGFAGNEDPATFDLTDRDFTTNETILSGDIDEDGSDDCYHVFYHPPGLALTSAAVLSGFTITGGYAHGGNPHNYGGGMCNYYSSPEISNCTFSGNSASYGGGMRNHGSSPTLTNCTFSGNSAVDNGGGMYNYSSLPEISNCTFSGNSAVGNGGGMYNDYSLPEISNCTFSENSGYYSGGMYNDYSSPEISNCTFSGNSALYGGGMLNYCSSAEISNCTFSGNSVYFGGGMFNESSSPTLTNCTFSGNTASFSGGGMLNYDSSSPTVTNCILWGNTATTSGDEVYNYDSGSTPAFSHCNIEGSGGSSAWDDALGTNDGNNLDSDSLFIRDPDAGDDAAWGTDDDDYGDLHLTYGSSCIDTGDNGSFTTDDTDMDGETRIFNGTIDMGADEFVDSDGDGLSDYEETPAIVTTSISGDTSEAGDTATFTVRLKCQPDGDVILTVTSGNTTEGTVSPATLTFTTDNWNAYQTVMVVGVDDDENDGDQTYNVQLDVDGDNTDDTSGYTDLDTTMVAVTNVDDDSEETDATADSSGSEETDATAGSSGSGGGGCFISSIFEW